jgi:hypothetical protein
MKQPDGRSFATISVDVDPVDLHLAGYGHPGLAADELVYRLALPRLLEILARHSVLATFFVVSRDVVAERPILRGLVEAGHEIASHSATHPVGFSRLAVDQLRQEIVRSRQELESELGVEVTGFRAPNWDLDPRAVPILAQAGYRYDASGFPSWLQLAARVALAVKARRPEPLVESRLWPFTFRRLPHRWRAGGAVIDEYPISVTPAVRWPVYHTLRYMVDADRFEAQLDGFVRRGEPVLYPIHGVDALGLVEDRVDERLARHPGMDRPLPEKLELLDQAIASLARRFRCVPYREHPVREG